MTNPIRQPAVAGSFYPASAAQARSQIERMWPRDEVPEPRLLAVLPHAGWMYSGAVAARTLARTCLTERVILLGVNHRGRGARLASFPSGAWMTPLGEVAIDEALVASIAAGAPELVPDTEAHEREHSLEVLVPLLQARATGTLRIAPVLIATHAWASLQTLGRAVAAAIREAGEPILLIASTDFTHYEDAASAWVKDERAIACILALEGRSLLTTVERLGITMCGVGPTVAALVAARELGAEAATLVQYATSGDVTGDQASVVGYAGLTAP